MKIKDYRGYSIEYIPDSGNFEALKEGETLYQRKTQKAVEVALDKAEKKVFQRIEVLDWRGQRITITSWDSVTGEGWVTGPTGRSKFGRFTSYYKLTPENLARAEDAKRLGEEIAALSSRKEGLLKALSDKVILEEVSDAKS